MLELQRPKRCRRVFITWQGRERPTSIVNECSHLLHYIILRITPFPRSSKIDPNHGNQRQTQRQTQHLSHFLALTNHLNLLHHTHPTALLPSLLPTHAAIHNLPVPPEPDRTIKHLAADIIPGLNEVYALHALLSQPLHQRIHQLRAPALPLVLGQDIDMQMRRILLQQLRRRRVQQRLVRGMEASQKRGSDGRGTGFSSTLDLIAAGGGERGRWTRELRGREAGQVGGLVARR